jgi:hypothetical protein
MRRRRTWASFPRRWRTSRIPDTWKDLQGCDMPPGPTRPGSPPSCAYMSCSILYHVARECKGCKGSCGTVSSTCVSTAVGSVGFGAVAHPLPLPAEPGVREKFLRPKTQMSAFIMNQNACSSGPVKP